MRVFRLTVIVRDFDLVRTVCFSAFDRAEASDTPARK